MERSKSVKGMVKETCGEKPAEADRRKHKKKKMKKSGYVEAKVVEPVDGLKKGDKVL